MKFHQKSIFEYSTEKGTVLIQLILRKIEIVRQYKCRDMNNLFFFLLLLSLSGCCTVVDRSENYREISNNNLNEIALKDSLESVNEKFLNPELGILSLTVKEKEYGYPYPEMIYPNLNSNNTVTKFYMFCDRIKSRFSDSNITKMEAEKIYSILDKYEYHEESWGMPGPDYNPKKFDVRKRIMIKKISHSNFEIFYSLSGCGAHIIYEHITILNDEIMERESIEKWRVHYPC